MPEATPGPLDIVLWGVFPYIMLVVLVGGLLWRHRYDQFGWTTRSSQLYESRLLRIASPLSLIRCETWKKPCTMAPP